ATAGLACVAVHVGHSLLNPDAVGRTCSRSGDRVGVDDCWGNLASAPGSERSMRPTRYVALVRAGSRSLRYHRILHFGLPEHHGGWDAAPIQLDSFRVGADDRYPELLQGRAC